jgi:hypothetical protein
MNMYLHSLEMGDDWQGRHVQTALLPIDNPANYCFMFLLLSMLNKRERVNDGETDDFPFPSFVLFLFFPRWIDINVYKRQFQKWYPTWHMFHSRWLSEFASLCPLNYVKLNSTWMFCSHYKTSEYQRVLFISLIMNTFCA